jgi:hypothetical protein
LASGIPVGGHIEFIDQNTLSKALENRAVFWNISTVKTLSPKQESVKIRPWQRRKKSNLKKISPSRLKKLMTSIESFG